MRNALKWTAMTAGGLVAIAAFFTWGAWCGATLEVAASQDQDVAEIRFLLDEALLLHDGRTQQARRHTCAALDQAITQDVDRAEPGWFISEENATRYGNLLHVAACEAQPFCAFNEEARRALEAVRQTRGCPAPSWEPCWGPPKQHDHAEHTEDICID